MSRKATPLQSIFLAYQPALWVYLSDVGMHEASFFDTREMFPNILFKGGNSRVYFPERHHRSFDEIELGQNYNKLFPCVNIIPKEKIIQCVSFDKPLRSYNFWHNFVRLGFPEHLESWSSWFDEHEIFLGLELKYRTNSERDSLIFEYCAMQVGCNMIYRMSKHYDFFVSFKHDVLNAFRSKLRVVSFGQHDFTDVEASLLKLVARDPTRCSESAVDDLIIYAIAENAPYKGNHVEKGREYEETCRILFEKFLWRAGTTPSTGDFGADIIVSKNNTTYVVQCKDHIKPIGIKAIQEVVAAASYYNADGAVVVARNGFTNAAEQLASSNGVMLTNENGIEFLNPYEKI